MSGPVNDGHRMVAALEAAGFAVLGRGRGYVRMGRPDAGSGWWPVPTDPTAPEFAEGLAKVRQVLLAEVAQGESAQAALTMFDGEVL
ncbi:hypothetical protein AB0K35_28220 [Micromonospora sp. NPDC053740]|uniref:hypothetical protein n=1 Tax=Micromonospora sp. NPDC053740 TaxID=3155173 RepID=UPI003448F3C5